MRTPVEKIADFDKFGSVLGLERIEELLRRLGNPHKDLKIIHIAGTNGKGSVSRFIYQMLLEAGYNTGIYSSPFLEVFNERIELNGEYISNSELDVYADKVSKIAQEMCEEGLLSPTEFDVVTAIAFIHFAQMKADFVILEVGLGGRGDSTNVIKNPVATVITSISMDHMDRLGNTIEEITMEKAGIIKEGVTMISGIGDETPKSIVQARCKEMKAPFVDATEKNYTIVEESIFGSAFTLNIGDKVEKDIRISMAGRHQVENAIVAMSTVAVLKESGIINISKKQVLGGLEKAKNKGRFEVLKKNPYYIIDGAHNEAGMESFVRTVQTDLKDKKLLVVVGILEEKEDGIRKSLKALDAKFIATEPNNPRKLDREKMKEILLEEGKDVIGTFSPEEAIHYVDSIKQNYDVILFVGSLYMIGEIRRLINAG